MLGLAVCRTPGLQVLMDQKVRRIMTSVLSALEHLHAQGWVHNDVKLENFVRAQRVQDPPGLWKVSLSA